MEHVLHIKNSSWAESRSSTVLSATQKERKSDLRLLDFTKPQIILKRSQVEGREKLLLMAQVYIKARLLR